MNTMSTPSVPAMATAWSSPARVSIIRIVAIASAPAT
jgi:hypothetical protein